MPTYKYRLLGTGTTNGQGIATLNKDPNEQTITGYTGVGAGKVDIIACDTNNPNDSEALLSTVKEILDCISYDKGTSADHNDTMWNSVTKFTRGDTYTTIAKDTQDYGVWTSITDNTCIELDIKMNPSSGSAYLMTLRNGTTNVFNITKNNTGLVNEEWQHYVISILDGTVTVTNTTTEVTATGTASNPTNFQIRILSNDNTYIKEVKIYPI